jgi:hypothetical protein
MSVPSGVWSRSVRLVTTPTPLLYDVRGRLLNELRGLASVERFRVRDDDIAVVFEGPREVHVGMESILCSSYVPDDDPRWIVRPLDVIERAIEPKVTSLVASFQHLIEVEGPTESLTEQSAKLAMGSIAESIGVYDYANLVDGIDRETGLAYQAEFGIINADEAPFRLARFAGRAQGETSSSMDLIVAMDFPEAAVFVDSRWSVESEFAPGDHSALVSSVHIFEMAADRLAEQISETVTPTKVRQG